MEKDIYQIEIQNDGSKKVFKNNIELLPESPTAEEIKRLNNGNQFIKVQTGIQVNLEERVRELEGEIAEFNKAYGELWIRKDARIKELEDELEKLKKE